MIHLTIKMMQSLDGFIGQNQDDKLLWGSSQDKQLYKQISTEYGTVIVGKNTYMQMPKIAFKNRETFVVVRDVSNFLIKQNIEDLEVQTYKNIKFAVNDNITFIESNPVEIIRYLESLSKTKALLVGGGIINNLFLKAGLVSELQITIAPKIFGSGIKIFGDAGLDLDLELNNIQKITDNEIVLNYTVLN